MLDILHLKQAVKYIPRISAPHKLYKNVLASD